MPRPLPLAIAAVVGALVLTACAPAVEPEATPTPSVSDEPAATAAPEALVVGAGEKPHTVFGGDCDAALSPADIRSVTGVDLALASSESSGDVGNVGGLTCRWDAEGASLVVEILPQAGLGGAEFPADQVPYYFEECDPSWVCSGAAETDAAWLATSFQFFEGMTRPVIDEWTTALADVALANLDDGAPVWERDREGWWPVLDCGAIAAAVGAELGADFTGDAAGWIDPPLPGVLLASVASHRSGCFLVDGAHQIEVHASPGEAWAVPASPDDEPLDTGVTGIGAWHDSAFQSSNAQGYTLTDGVNCLQAYVASDASWSAEDAVRVLARQAADGWD